MELTPIYKTELVRELRQRLRNRRLLGLKFRRQHPVGRYIADFLCENPRCVIEIDGGYHETAPQQTLDQERAAFLVGSGYALLRLRAETVEHNSNEAVAQIRTFLQELQMSGVR